LLFLVLVLWFSRFPHGTVSILADPPNFLLVKESFRNLANPEDIP
jgi:hypothetical protein